MLYNDDNVADDDEGDEEHEAYGYDVCKIRPAKWKSCTAERGDCRGDAQEIACNIMQQSLPTSTLPIGSSKVHEQIGTWNCEQLRPPSRRIPP